MTPNLFFKLNNLLCKTFEFPTIDSQIKIDNAMPNPHSNTTSTGAVSINEADTKVAPPPAHFGFVKK